MNIRPEIFVGAIFKLPKNSVGTRLQLAQFLFPRLMGLTFQNLKQHEEAQRLENSL
ncbi:MAG: hypothetical protein ACK4Y7_03345 [Caldimicrobium sp.]